MMRLLELNEGVISFFAIGFTSSVLTGLVFNSEPNIEVGLIFGAILAVVRILLFVFGIKIGAEFRNG
jgi:hypothetical protein